jgi:hypothetical protein
MRVFWNMLAVMGVLGAIEASAANWNEGAIYAPNGMVDQLERGTGVWREDIGEPEPAPIILAEARKPAKRGASGAASAAFDTLALMLTKRHKAACADEVVLIDIAEEVVGNGRAGLERTRTMRGKDMFADIAIEELRRQIGHFCRLGDRVIDQARRRVLFGEQVATDEKIYSIFEPHTDLIKPTWMA